MNDDVIKKFKESIEKVNDCWIWTGQVNSRSKCPIITTGQNRKNISARKISFIVADKEIINGRPILPLICRNKLCVNPDHLGCGDEARFWSKVQKLSEEQGGCWVWTASQDKDMYGAFHFHENGKMKNIKAHIFSWQLYTRRIVPTNHGIMICHKCDHPYCVNPEHLFLGTAQDNMDDMITKERSLKGIKNKKSKLTEEKVNEIRKLYDKQLSFIDISKLYSISYNTVRDIVFRRTWKHI